MQYHYAFDMYSDEYDDDQDDILSGITMEQLAELKMRLDSYQTSVTKEQFAMANDIFAYDPDSAIRYCKLVRVSNMKKAFRKNYKVS